MSLKVSRACATCDAPGGDFTIVSDNESVIAVSNWSTSTTSGDRVGVATLTARGGGRARINISYSGDGNYKAEATQLNLTVMAAPAAPGNFRATSAAGQVSLAWDAVWRATSYQLLRDGTQVGGSITADRYTDTGLVPGTGYSYSLKACNASGCSVTPTTASVTTAAGYVLSLNANGGTLGSTRQVTVDAGGTLSSGTSGLPTRNGFVVGGWNTKADGSGTPFVFGTTSVDADIAIYPQWVAVKRLPHSGITVSQCYVSGSGPLAACSAAAVTALNGQQDGHRAGLNAMSYSQVGSYSKEECVQDNLTELIWEGKTSGGTRAGSNQYSNHNVLYGSTQAQMDAATNSYGYVAAVNAMELCGYSDWRLPTMEELQTLVDYGVSFGPMINSMWFPNTGGFNYWASSLGVAELGNAWVVDFANAFFGVGRGYAGVRLVRGSQGVSSANCPTWPTAERFVLNGGEVTDRHTGLVWKRCSEGQSWDGSTCTGRATTTHKHEQALTLANLDISRLSA